MVLRPILVGGLPGCVNLPSNDDCQCWPLWSSDNAYSFGDVVQQGGVLYTANRDIPPGTPFLAGDWTVYTPGATLVPPHREDASYQQYQAVNFNDKLYTARTDLPPGPFDPANWQEISVEGLVEVADSSTIDFSGDGSASDPLTADVKLDPVAGNLLTATPDGLVLLASNIPFPDPSSVNISDDVTLRVDEVTGDDATADGSLQKPYKTIVAAIGASNAGDNIEVYPGNYVGNFAPKSDTTVTGRGFVYVDGDVTIGAAVSGVTVSGLFIDGNLTMAGANGAVEFINSTVSTSIIGTGNNTGWFLFDEVNADSVSITGAGTGEFIFRGGVEQTDFSLNAPSKLLVENRSRVGVVNHLNGLMILKDIGVIVSLTSTADDNAFTFLAVISSSLFDPDPRTYGALTKTGSCSYAFQDFARSNMAETVTGAKWLVSNGRDIHGNYDPNFYALPNGQSLNSHFEGIDNALQTLQEYSPLGRSVAVDFGFSIIGGWSADETVGVHAVSHETVIPANMLGSIMVTDSSTLDGVLNVMVGTSVVGTVTITDGAAVFASSEFNLDPGQLVRIVSTTEGTFEYVGLTLVGHRQVVYVD